MKDVCLACIFIKVSAFVFYVNSTKKNYMYLCHLSVSVVVAALYWRTGAACAASCGELSHWAHFLLKQKYKATNKHICKPQHNVHIKFKPSARQQSPRPLYTVFVDCAVCELVPAWTALTHWQRQWTCETSCKMYSGAAGQSFVKIRRCFACWANVWEKNFSDF